MSQTFPPPLSGTLQDEARSLRPRFDRNGLIAAIAQDAETGDVLMLAWMNEAALQATLETGNATYWSRSRSTLWVKGETSGNTQDVVEVRIDCDQDAVLLKVHQTGGACHTGRPSCFYRRVGPDGATLSLDTESAKESS
ncbi:MAG: phosphoribosyl-AMP cyclohydrolase [Pseudomonadota bacterium]